MGSTTKFKGTLKFTPDVSVSQLARLGTILSEDRRDHPEWNAPDTFYYVDLEITKDFSGLQWTGIEKSYGMDDQVRTVLRLMQEKFPDFMLVGEMSAQGEQLDDVWRLVIKDGIVTRIDLDVKGIVECPSCKEKFIPQGQS